MPLDFGFGCRCHCVTTPKPSSEGHISPLARKKKTCRLACFFMYLFIYFLYYDYSRNLLTRRVECCCVTCFAAASLLPPFFQDLATSGGDCEDGEGVGHHHHALHRGGPAGRRGETLDARTHTHTHIHTHLHTGGEMNATQTTKQSSHTVFDPLTRNNESVCASFAR